MADKQAADFKTGDRVLYIPNHAHDDRAHPDCEHGIVSSTNDSTVFVKYFTNDGGLKLHAQATYPHNLERT